MTQTNVVDISGTTVIVGEKEDSVQMIVLAGISNGSVVVPIQVNSSGAVLTTT